MAPLNSARKEKFVLALLEGRSATEAYTIAGYRPSRQNASRLMANEDVQARLAELQNGVAKSAAITVQSIVDELDAAIAVAKNAKQATAMVSAAALKSKLGGLLIERIETGGPGDFDNLYSTAAIAGRVLEKLVERFVPVDQADLDGLVALYEKHLAETEEFLASIRARPIVAERVDARHLDRPWQSHAQYAPKGSLRIGYRSNGSKHHTQPPEPEVKKVAAEE